MVSDDELRWRLGLLKKALDEDKISIAPHLIREFQKSLGAVRTGSDGLIDLSTVDGRIRSMALAIQHFHQRDEAKDLISLAEVQHRYFEFIEATFGEIHRFMKEKGSDPHAVSWIISRDPEAVSGNIALITPFIEDLANLWSAVAESCEYHIQDLKNLKGVFGGDLFPSYERNIASTTGLYLDTIVLTDPFMNSRMMFQKWDDETAVRFFIKHGLNVLNYRDLALAKLDIPIVVIVPFKSSIDEADADILMRMAMPDAIRHASTLFGRHFENVEDLWKFADGLDSVEKAVSAIHRPDRFLIDTEWTGPIAEQLAKATADNVAAVGMDHPGEYLFNQCVGRMRQATDVLMKSQNLLGTPLIDAETSWRYLNWKLEYDAAFGPDKLVPLHTVKGLQRIGKTDMEWIGNIPPQALIEMRQQGAMEDIRSMLTNGMSEVAEANPSNFFRSADLIVDNIQNAFELHQENVRAIRSKGLKFWGKDIGSWIVKGSIEMGAAIVGTPAMGLAALAIDQVIDSPKLNEIPERYRKLRAAKDEHAKSPMGLLFKHKV